MDVYNRGQWQDDPDAVEQLVSVGFFGGTTTYDLYSDQSILLFGRPDGAFIAIRETGYDEQGIALATYPYLVTLHLYSYQFQFAAPDFVSVLLFCREYHPLIVERNRDLQPGC